jgi:hypothetical protein
MSSQWDWFGADDDAGANDEYPYGTPIPTAKQLREWDEDERWYREQERGY